ncbi:hypothetical protein [Cellulomonas fengjieae]|uniref:Uncharacterized protein n=1 Tax=Cellulomonas fengjieae TaxID=2819978 RepID=A0ABS3SLI9_9CELL|nr:hypothetical protein [Cellulomonas fengjieae]MBO3086587.1 hypothetical protein [Cellulomonas fengjieae]QVI66560.1 hypothetical protein KG102_02850 [Cellulomonas fengjieae]
MAEAARLADQQHHDAAERMRRQAEAAERYARDQRSRADNLRRTAAEERGNRTKSGRGLGGWLRSLFGGGAHFTQSPSDQNAPRQTKPLTPPPRVKFGDPTGWIPDHWYVESGSQHWEPAQNQEAVDEAVASGAPGTYARYENGSYVQVTNVPDDAATGPVEWTDEDGSEGRSKTVNMPDGSTVSTQWVTSFTDDGSPQTTVTTVQNNPDDSTNVVVKRPDGSTTESTTNSDGSQLIIETGVNGSIGMTWTGPDDLIQGLPGPGEE